MVSKVTYTDITNKQTNGESGAALVNDTKRAINEVIDLVGDIDLGGVGGSTLPVLQPRQLGDGVKTTFNTPATGTQGAKAQHFDVYLNYVYQRPALDFSIDGATGDLTFLDNTSPYAPNLNDTVDIKYVKPYTFDTSSDTPVEGTGTGVTKSIGDWFGEAGPAKVTATGTTTSRSLADRFGEAVNVRDFESLVVDGDWTEAFNAFFSVIKSKSTYGVITPPNTVEDGPTKAVIPAGRYLCLGSINATNIRGLGWTLEAEGATIHSKATGKAAVDLLGSRWGTIIGLKITGDETNTPRVGFQYGRTVNKDNSCDNFHFDRCKTDGYFEFTSVYNLGSETDSHMHPEYYNSEPDGYCLVLDGDNTWGATSDYIPAPSILVGNQPMSNIQHTFVSADIRQRNTGDAIWVARCQQLKFINSYCVCRDGSGVVFVDDSEGFNDIHIDMHFETGDSLHCVEFKRKAGLSFIWSIYRGFHFKDHAPFASDSIFKIDDNLDRVILVDSDIHIARLGKTPTNKLTATPNKLYVSGSLFGIAAVINGIKLFGELIADDINSIGSLPQGTYISKSQSGNVKYHGGITPNDDNVQYIGNSSNRYARGYFTQIRIGGGEAIVLSGTGSPEGVIAANIGSMYTRDDGSTGTTLYIKEAGSGNTGWVAK